MNKIITGYWRGDPIWRDETPQERASRELSVQTGKDESNNKGLKLFGSIIEKVTSPCRPMRVKDAYADTYQQDTEETDHTCSSDCRRFGHNF